MRENSQRDTFIFYRSFKESMNELSDADKLIMYEAISDYSLDMKEPELTGFPKALFSIIRPIIDANWQRYNNGCKGGAPKGNKNNRFSKSTTEVQPKVNQSTTEVQPKYKLIYNDNVNDNKNKNIEKEKIIKEKSLSLSDRTKKFKEELTPFVEKYGKDMIFAFFDYWSEPDKAKNKMRCEMQKTWSTAGRLRTWERRNNEKR
ncbi:DUF6291 domain-containing protein [Bacteroides cellulosilyticus]|uniref:DUF6291 domain-containing protein n=1 Tax=Bacteroides cellulosilyticus TaxID=246787 RepID=UPI001C375728|nr:DUF6291 domain-containing protein [Bacteroides cellulosilyticus]MBV3636737.1 hypothetical protein [Bacteroides cellulosilyticus]MBV3663052.1 hypothetical protein [Bacteroides cellulosilyticus]MBV3685173.1 hypothetical protein [Bacteroides cellulosilyticus]MBV3693739.1 hypothetical protein [Bacteroides cellulosilyticus]MBV3707226.1 hypothetical protein [Bacteroides cellulosilyticus]